MKLALALAFIFSTHALGYFDVKINLTGKVIDEGLLPLPGAQVVIDMYLSDYGIRQEIRTVTSAADGTFSFVGTFRSKYEIFGTELVEFRACGTKDGYARNCKKKSVYVYEYSRNKVNNMDVVLRTLGGCLVNSSDFESADGGCQDLSTGHVWVASPSSKHTWQQAISYCDTLDFNGFTDWYLPNQAELLEVSGSELASKHFNFPTDRFYWSTQSVDSKNALAVRLSNGTSKTIKKSSGGSVACIRN